MKKRLIKICVDCWEDVCRGYERGNESAELFLLYGGYPNITYVSKEECEVCCGQRESWVDKLKKPKKHLLEA
jgi:hypothetical protein